MVIFHSYVKLPEGISAIENQQSVKQNSPGTMVIFHVAMMVAADGFFPEIFANWNYFSDLRVGGCISNDFRYFQLIIH